MPVYDYLCETCGPFSETRPMALYQAPCDCPDCGASAPRAILAMPALFGMDGATRKAIAVNEQSRHAPKTSKAYAEERAGRKHPANCGCCTAKTNKGVFRADGAKTFPSARPWMISH